MDYPEDTLSGAVLGLNLLNRVAFSRKHKASRVTWHTHEHYELILALDGATVYEFIDGQTVDFTGGHYMLIAPGVAHRGLQDVRRPTAIVGLMLDPHAKRATQGSPFDAADLEWLFGQFAEAGRQAHPMNAELKSLGKTVSRSLGDTPPTSAMEFAKQRWALCGIVLEAAKQLAATRPDVPDQTVEHAIAFMNGHLSEPCPIEEVAKALGCSRAKLFDVFKDSTGMTPYDYWLRLRIDHAQHLLLGSSQAVPDIASNCGFSTSQYFSLVFRKYSGLNPNEYREQFQLG